MSELRAWTFGRGWFAVDVLTTLTGQPYQVRVKVGTRYFYSRLLGGIYAGMTFAEYVAVKTIANREASGHP